jgi:uncharacterized caspase-like protein
LLADAQATRQAIVDGLTWLAVSCDATSTAYFFYSGHGCTGIDDLDGDEPDGFDEGLVPADTINPDNYFDKYLSDNAVKLRVDASLLTDDDLQTLLAAVAQECANLIVILDSCHSAGATKDLGNPPLGVKAYHTALGIDPTLRPRPPQHRPPSGPATGPLTDYGQTSSGSPGTDATSADSYGIGDQLFYEGQSTLDNVVVLAASEPTQYSQADPDLGHGTYTFALLDAIYNRAVEADLDGDGRLSWFEAATYAHFWVSAESESSAAMLNDEAELQYPVIYNAERAATIFVDAPTVGTGRQLLKPIPLPFDL